MGTGIWRGEDVMTCTKHQAFRDLASTVCACGGKKQYHMSFCSRCYYSLPKPLRAALYDTHDDYVGPYNRALQDLGLESPSAREDQLRADAIREGVQIVMRETQLRAPAGEPL